MNEGETKIIDPTKRDVLKYFMLLGAILALIFALYLVDKKTGIIEKDVPALLDRLGITL